MPENGATSNLDHWLRGREPVTSASRVPRPPARITTRIALHDHWRGDGDDESSAVFTIRSLLLDDLVGEIPRQDEHVVRPLARSVSTETGMCMPGVKRPTLRGFLSTVYGTRSGRSRSS